jgi:hypothetical protein
MRVQHIADRRAKGENPFPHKFNVSISLVDFIAKYESLNAEQVLTDVTVSVAGQLCIPHRRCIQSTRIINDLQRSNYLCAHRYAILSLHNANASEFFQR